jgi:hypothetical protein
MRFVRYLCLGLCVAGTSISSVTEAAGPRKPAYHATSANIVARSSAARRVLIPQVAARTQIVRQRIMVPQTTTEKRTVLQQQIQYQNRPQTVTVFETVPHVVNVNRIETVMTTETRLQPQTQTFNQPVYRDIVEPVSVAVQGVENRVGTRQVLRTVPVRVQVPVTKQCQCVTTVPGMAAQTSYSQPVTQFVEQIQYQQQLCNEQFTYQVPVTQYQTQHRTRRVVEYQQVQQTVNVPVQVQVPQQRVRTEQVTQYRRVARQVVQNQTVAVPVTVRREINVPVTRMVLQTVERCVTVPQVKCAPKPPCGSQYLGR